MKDCSSLEANSFPPELQMADVHTFSVDHIVAALSNSMNSIENSASPILAPHDINYLLNLSSEYLFDSGVWQQFDPNPQVPFSSALLGGDPPSALILPHLGFGFNDEMDQGGSMEEVIDRLGNSQFRADDQSLASDSTECSFKIGEENGWRGLDGSTNTAFGLDLTKKNKSLVATSCQASLTSDSALAGHPKTFSSFCNSRFSQLQTPDKSEAMGMGNKHTKASNSPPMATRSGVRPMQPVYQSEEEYQCGASPKNSSSPGHNMVQNFCSQLKEVETGKKRKETSQCDEPRKERKTDDMKIKGQRNSESSKEAEEIKKKEEPHTSGHFGDSGHAHAKGSPKPPEPPKLDYIHVRARRGQATDSHSLAERVRREKISERMKCLQDLVPGCRKVSRKALMLDEIINYVQSLQCQVELLSMKLAAVNHPRLDFSLNSIFPKELFQGYISPPTFAFNHELISNLPLLGSAQAKLNQLGVRSMGGLNSRSQTRSNATVLGGNIFRDVNSQTGLELSRTASVANPTFNDQMHVQHLKTEL